MPPSAYDDRDRRRSRSRDRSAAAPTVGPTYKHEPYELGWMEECYKRVSQDSSKSEDFLAMVRKQDRLC